MTEKKRAKRGQMHYPQYILPNELAEQDVAMENVAGKGFFDSFSSSDRKDAIRYKKLYRRAKINAWMSFAALLVVAAFYFALIFNV